MDTRAVMKQANHRVWLSFAVLLLFSMCPLVASADVAFPDPPFQGPQDTEWMKPDVEEGVVKGPPNATIRRGLNSSEVVVISVALGSLGVLGGGAFLFARVRSRALVASLLDEGDDT